MGLSVNKNGLIEINTIVEEHQYGKAASFYKNINSNLIPGIIDIITTKSGTQSSKITIASILGNIIKSLAGQTLCAHYEVCTPGARYSTEQGQTAQQYTRYGVHGCCTIDGSTSYPFADYLNYSGDARLVTMTWTIPTGKTNYGDLTIAVQNFDKPASTNNNIQFIRNYKIEVGNSPTPYSIYDLNVSGNCISCNEIIET